MTAGAFVGLPIPLTYSDGIIPPPPPVVVPGAGGGGRRRDRDLGRYWVYRPRKKLEEELDKIEAEIAPSAPPISDDRLVELEMEAEQVRAEASKRAFAAVQAHAIEVLRLIEHKMQEEEEEQAAWLLLQHFD